MIPFFLRILALKILSINSKIYVAGHKGLVGSAIIRKLKSKGYKKNQGLAMTGIIIRKHTERIKRLNEKWWAEVCRGSKRDQLSFNYIFDQEITYLDWPGSYNNDWFQRPNHQSSFLMRIRNSYLYPMKKILSK